MNRRLSAAAVFLVLASLGLGAGRLRAQPPIATQEAATATSVWDGVYTVEQAGRGEAIYARECSSCHGTTLNDGAETPLADAAFRDAWKGFSVADLLERISKTMPDSDPGKLPAQEYVDILAHIFRVNQFPAGKAELEGRPDALKQIRIDAAPADITPTPQ